MRKILRCALTLAAASLAFAASTAHAVYSITLVDYPGAVFTDIRAINNSGRIAGYASLDGTNTFGFTYLGGVFTAFPPAPGGVSTYAHGINDAGVVAGGMEPATGNQGLILNGGAFTFFSKPGWLNTNVRFITNSGLVVGYADDGSIGPAGFIYNPATSTFLDIIVPGSTFTIPQGMNAAGQLVGSARVPGVGTESFLRQPGGTMSFFQLDGQSTRARGINDLGVMTGNLADTLGNFHAWVGTSLGYELIDVPGAVGGTVGQSINNAGQVSGFYYDGLGNAHGFIASPAVLPTGTTSGGAYTFSVNVVPNVPIFIDPAPAVAYDYQLGKKDPMFASVRLPIGVGDSMYMLVVEGRHFAIGGGTLFDFRANGFRKGVKGFRVACIEPSANLDPANPLAFVTEVTFTDAGRFTGTQKPLTDNANGKTLCEKASKGEGDDDEGDD